MVDVLERVRATISGRASPDALSLSLHGVTDTLAEAVASMLLAPDCASLCRLDLSCNSLGPVGADVLINAIERHPAVGGTGQRVRGRCLVLLTKCSLFFAIRTDACDCVAVEGGATVVACPLQIRVY